MGKIDSNSDSNSGKSAKQFFGGNPHKLTNEDRKKGGKKSTARKTRANGMKNLKTGNYSVKIPKCHTCRYKSKCSYYDLKDPKAICKAIAIPNFLQLLDALEFKSAEEADDFISILLQRLYLKNLTTKDWNIMKDFVHIILKVRESRSKAENSNTVNIQINNFHNEFNIFKDTTIKILKKHPKIMKEWRGAIESATKQSD